MSRKTRSDTPATGSFRQALRDTLNGREFATFEELQEVIREQESRHNALAGDDRQGLSPAQMHSLLQTPFEVPELVRFADNPDSVGEAPMMRLFLLLATTLQSARLKATTKGNLPRQTVRDTARAYWSPAEYEHRARLSSFSSEDDFDDLHTVRLVAQQAGLIRRYKGHFQLTRRGTGLLEPDQHGRLYMSLFRAWCERFNWAYRDLYPELPIVQHSFVFTLLLLRRALDSRLRLSDYSRAFLRAFPQATEEVEDSLFDTSREEAVRRCYELRALRRFAVPCGLARLTPSAHADLDLLKDHQVQVLPLLRKVVRFPGLAGNRSQN